MPLYLDCMKFTKISVIFKSYNLKVKNKRSDKIFTSLLKLLGYILSDNNKLPDLIYKAEKTIMSFEYGYREKFMHVQMIAYSKRV
jgi:hypothetical protein